MYIFDRTDYSISPTEDDDEMIPEKPGDSPGNSGDEGSSQHHKVKVSRLNFLNYTLTKRVDVYPNVIYKV